MNVINEEQVAAVIVKPALDRLENSIIPALEAAIKRRVDEALHDASNLVMITMAGVQGVENGVMEDAKKLLVMLDGWTATIAIPVITVQLNGPAGFTKGIEGGVKK